MINTRSISFAAISLIAVFIAVTCSYLHVRSRRDINTCRQEVTFTYCKYTEPNPGADTNSLDGGSFIGRPKYRRELSVARLNEMFGILTGEEMRLDVYEHTLTNVPERMNGVSYDQFLRWMNNVEFLVDVRPPDENPVMARVIVATPYADITESVISRYVDLLRKIVEEDKLVRADKAVMNLAEKSEERRKKAFDAAGGIVVTGGVQQGGK